MTALRPPSPEGFWEAGFPATQDDPRQAHLLRGARPRLTRPARAEDKATLPSQFEYTQAPVATGWLSAARPGSANHLA